MAPIKNRPAHPLRSWRTRITTVLLLILHPCTTLATTNTAHAPTSPKRGLVYIDNVTPSHIFLTPPSDLTWYYNYGNVPTTSLISSSLQFVPMLWGASTSSPGTGFAKSVQAQITSGANITAVLAFNEPDACDNGGSCVDPTLAATVWKQEMVPLQSAGIQVGSPATTGSQGGLDWMRQWFNACDGGCKPDFLAVHWYGDFQGLASWMGHVNASFANHTKRGAGMWITEFADANADLAATQKAYNTSTEYFDRLSYVDRYSYFGAFKSDVSNVGPNVAMLDSGGALTDIGSWYLGGAATGNIPSISCLSKTISPFAVIVAVMAAVAVVKASLA